MVVPEADAAKAALIAGVQVIPAPTLAELTQHLNGERPIAPYVPAPVPAGLRLGGARPPRGSWGSAASRGDYSTGRIASAPGGFLRVYLARRAAAGMATRRVIWALLSQYVTLPVIHGSSGAGWTRPSVAIARDVTACSPGVGLPQS